jgi:hypothetical protein
MRLGSFDDTLFDTVSMEASLRNSNTIGLNASALCRPACLKVFSWVGSPNKVQSLDPLSY